MFVVVMIRPFNQVLKQRTTGILVLLTLMLFASCLRGSFKKGSWRSVDEYELKGPVQSLSTLVYPANNEDDSFENRLDRYWSADEVTFDELGLERSVTVYQSPNLTSRSSYYSFYRVKNRRVMERSRSYGMGRLIYVYSYGPGGLLDTITEYDKHEMDETKGKGNVSQRKIYSYDEDNRLIKIQNIGRDNDSTLYYYDENGAKVESKRYAAGNYFSSELDEFGNPVKTLSYDHSDSLIGTSIIKYRYDEHNNWVRKTEKGEISHIIRITQRTIKYY